MRQPAGKSCGKSVTFLQRRTIPRMLPCIVLRYTIDRRRTALVRRLADDVGVWIAEDEVAGERCVEENAERDGYRADSEGHQQKSIDDERNVLPGDAVRRRKVLLLQSSFTALQGLTDPGHGPHQPALQVPRFVAQRLCHSGARVLSKSTSGYSVTSGERLGVKRSSRWQLVGFAAAILTGGVGL